MAGNLSLSKCPLSNKKGLEAMQPPNLDALNAHLITSMNYTINTAGLSLMIRPLSCQKNFSDNSKIYRYQRSEFYNVFIVINVPALYFNVSSDFLFWLVNVSER